ncbi:MAG: thioester dehydrase [Neisseria sp.]|nr:thioester dehydrase [Neisseria sp.]
MPSAANLPLTCPINQVAPLLPHSGHMVLLDSVLAYDEHSLQASAIVKQNNILLAGNAIPCFMGMEIVAQGIGAWAGIHAINAGKPVGLGFLLGTRKLNLFADSIPIGTHLHIEIAVSTQDSNGFGVFDCLLRWTDAPPEQREQLPADGILLQAALNVYSPPEAQSEH